MYLLITALKELVNKIVLFIYFKMCTLQLQILTNVKGPTSTARTIKFVLINPGVRHVCASKDTVWKAGYVSPINHH